MKKVCTIIFAAISLVVAIVSCNKDESIPSTVMSEDASIKVNINVSAPSTGTKAVKTGWVAGDVINIWFDVCPAENKALEGPDFTLVRDSDGKWNAEKFREGILELLKPHGEFYGFWEDGNSCFKSGTDWTNGGSYSQFPGVNEDKNKTTGVTGCLAASFSNIGYAYDRDRNELTADINSWSFGEADIQIVVASLEYEEGRYTLYSDQVNCLKHIEIGTTANECKVRANSTDGGAHNRIAGIANEDGVAFVGKITGASGQDYTFMLVDNTTGTEYTFTRQSVDLDSKNGTKLIAVKIPKERFSYPIGKITDKDNIDVGYVLYRDGTFDSPADYAAKRYDTKKVAGVVYHRFDPNSSTTKPESGSPYTNGLVIALKDISQDDFPFYQFFWSEKPMAEQIRISGDINLVEGWSATDAIRKWNDNNPANCVLPVKGLDVWGKTHAVTGTSGWYIPSIKELDLIFNGDRTTAATPPGQNGTSSFNKDRIDKLIEATAQGTATTNGVYWSSSEHSEDSVWCLHVLDGGVVFSLKKDPNLFLAAIRPVCAF